MRKAWTLSYPLSAQRRLWSDWADVQAELSSLGAQSFYWFCHEAAHMSIASQERNIRRYLSRSITKPTKWPMRPTKTRISLGIIFMRTAKTLIRLFMLLHAFYSSFLVALPWAFDLLTTMKRATWQNQQNGCAPSEDSDQPGHPPSLTRIFAVRMKKAWVLSYPLSAQRRLWSDWADAQADLSLRWAHTHFVGFVMSWLFSLLSSIERENLYSGVSTRYDSNRPAYLLTLARVLNFWADLRICCSHMA